MKLGRTPSIGLFLPRPERSFYMAQKLRERGFEVVHYNTQGYLDDSFVKVRKGAAPALAYLLLRTNHDVYFTSLSFVPSSCLYLNKRLRGKPYVFNATGVKWEMFQDRSREKPFSDFFARRFYPFLLDRTFAGASRIVCNSRFLESTLAAHYPQYRARLLTIYNGIEFERYSCGQRQTLPGISRGDVVFLFVTALNFGNKSKGLQLALDAFAQVRHERKAAKLVIAAKTSNRRYREWADRYVRSGSWGDSVEIFYNLTNIPDLLASSDIFVYATPHNSNDSLPRALLEAQAAGLPTVTTDTTGCPEIVCDEETGFVVPYEAHALARRMVQLLDSPQLRQDMGSAARQRIAQMFNWDRMADQYARVFLEVAGGAAPASRDKSAQVRRTADGQKA